MSSVVKDKVLPVTLICILLTPMATSSPMELKDDGDGLTGPEPSIIGSVDKVLKKVNEFDQYHCIQKLICEYMGSAETAVVNAVSNNLGGGAGQLTQNGFNQFNNNPSQFVQQFPGQVGNQLITQASTVGQNFQSQLANGQFAGSSSQLNQFGQLLASQGQQVFNQGQGQFFGQNQFNGQAGQFGNQFIGQNGQFGNQFVGQNGQSGNQFVGQNGQFGNQFIGQNGQFGNQFVGQNGQFAQQQFVSQNQFNQNGGSGLGGLGGIAGLENALADGLAGIITTGLFGGPGGKKRENEDGALLRENTDSQPTGQTEVNEIEEDGLEADVDTNDDEIRRTSRFVWNPFRRTLRRSKRQSSPQGHAIKMLQNFGLDKMAAYPYVRAALIGSANKNSPGNCRQLYNQCPDSTTGLLEYLNNHNGGLFQNAVPSATDEIGSLFPNIASVIPQVAASTIGDYTSSNTATSSGSSSSGLLGGIGGSGGTDSPFLNNIIDGLAGAIAGAMGRRK